MTAPVIEHQSSARSLRTGLIVMLVWLAILTIWIVLDAADVVIALLLLTTLPAGWDFASGRKAWLVLDGARLRWGSGRNEGEVALNKIEKVRFETRLDMSVRVRVVIDTGRRITLPQDSLPDTGRLQEGFEARGIATERHHFVLFGT